MNVSGLYIEQGSLIRFVTLDALQCTENSIDR